MIRHLLVGEVLHLEPILEVALLHVLPVVELGPILGGELVLNLLGMHIPRPLPKLRSSRQLGQMRQAIRPRIEAGEMTAEKLGRRVESISAAHSERGSLSRRLDLRRDVRDWLCVLPEGERPRL